MEFIAGHRGRQDEISELFLAAFSASEGAEEGKLISRLATRLMATTADEDLFVFSACDDRAVVGCIVFSRLTYELDDRVVFILSPVAVRPDRHKEGIGQELITFGLGALRRRGIDVVMTYGDPNYYAKVGFAQISEDCAQAPLPLTQPHGWLAQPLSTNVMSPLAGRSHCVDALNDPSLW